MNAIIVPGVTDLNKGDQALVWESWRLANDTNLYDKVYILDSGENEEERHLLCGQSKEYGFQFLDNILKHPRRGKHRSNEYVRESKLERVKQVRNAISDFKESKYLIKICKDLNKVRRHFDEKTFRTVEQFHKAKTIFVKGGGFIHAYGEFTAPYLMWYFLFYVRLAKALNKEVVFLPNSYGPFKGFTVKSQIESVFKKVDLIFSREHTSALKLGNLLKRDIPVEMDLGFFLENGPDEAALSVLDKYQLTTNDKIVGITVRPWRFPGKDNPTELYNKYIDSMANLIQYIVDRGYKVALCNQSLGPNAHEDDRNAIKDLLDKNNNEKITWINENLDCKTLKSLYSNFDFFIGTRFHSIIFSLTSNIPSIAIAYGGNKATGIMKDFGLEEFVISIDNLNVGSLIKMFDSIINQSDIIKHKLQNSCSEIEKSRNRLLQKIQAL